MKISAKNRMLSCVFGALLAVFSFGANACVYCVDAQCTPSQFGFRGCFYLIITVEGEVVWQECHTTGAICIDEHPWWEGAATSSFRSKLVNNEKFGANQLLKRGASFDLASSNCQSRATPINFRAARNNESRMPDSLRKHVKKVDITFPEIELNTAKDIDKALSFFLQNAPSHIAQRGLTERGGMKFLLPGNDGISNSQDSDQVKSEYFHVSFNINDFENSMSRMEIRVRKFRPEDEAEIPGTSRIHVIDLESVSTNESGKKLLRGTLNRSAQS